MLRERAPFRAWTIIRGNAKYFLSLNLIFSSFVTSVKIKVCVIWACQNTSMFLQNRLFQTKIKLFQCANLFPLRNKYRYFS